MKLIKTKKITSNSDSVEAIPQHIRSSSFSMEMM